MLSNHRLCKCKKSFLGFFDDPPPGPFDIYQRPFVKFREDMNKGQIRSGPPSKLFQKKFERIFQGESLTEPWREETKQRVFTTRMIFYINSA